MGRRMEAHHDTNSQAADQVEKIKLLVARNEMSNAAAQIESAFLRKDLTQEICIDLALQSRWVGKRELVHKFLLRAKELGPWTEALAYESALTAYDLSRYSESFDLFSRLTEDHPENVNYWYWLARVSSHVKENDSKYTADCFLEAVRRDSSRRDIVGEAFKHALNHDIDTSIFFKELEGASLSDDMADILILCQSFSSCRQGDFEAAAVQVEHLIESVKESRIRIHDLQSYCRSIFTDSLVRNDQVSLFSLKVFFDLAKLIDSRFGYGGLEASMEDACLGIGDFLNGRYTSRTLTVVHTSSQYFSAFRAWYYLASKLCIDSKLLIVALDENVVSLIAEEFPYLVDKVYLLPLFPKLHLIYGNGYERSFYWYIKVLLMRNILRSGYNIIQTDADAFWKKDISLIFEYEFECGGADIVSQREGGLPRAIANIWGFSLCAGFWGVRASERTVSFLNDLLKYTLYLWDDQVGLNKLLLDSKIKWLDCGGGKISGQILSEHGQHGLAVVALPERIATRVIWELDNPNVVAVHGQYFKHEDWVNNVIYGGRIDVDWPRWKKFFVFDHLRIGLDLFSLGNFAAAYKHLKPVSEVLPNEAQVWLKLGIACKALGYDDEARTAFSNLLAIDGAHVHGLMWMGIVHMDFNNYGKAIDLFERVIEIDPGHSNAYIQKYIALKKAGDLKAAYEALQVGLTVQPDCRDIQSAIEEVKRLMS